MYRYAPFEDREDDTPEPSIVCLAHVISPNSLDQAELSNALFREATSAKVTERFFRKIAVWREIEKNFASRYSFLSFLCRNLPPQERSVTHEHTAYIRAPETQEASAIRVNV
jgi:hypothetical protein